MSSFKHLSEALSSRLPTTEQSHPDLPLVVIIDDDVGVRTALALTLKENYQLRLCANAEEGIAAIDTQVQAIILDIKMHGHDGFWVYKAIRQKHGHVPIIFHSAYQDLKDPYEIINDYRPFGYITKGGEVQVLLRTLASAVAYSKEWQTHTKSF